jgi:uncharacterized protein involved in exopolysaccharide biosynthesis
MNDEIDLRPYLRALIRRWRWILLAALLGAVGAGLAALMQPTMFSSTASVFVRSTQSEVTLDPRFVTKDVADPIARRKTLLGFAKSPSVEMQIPRDVINRLAPSNYVVGMLASRISATSDGELIQITARDSTPEQARELADAWAIGFVSYANQLYGSGGGISDASARVREASDNYAAAQRAYEQFLGTSRIDELNQNIVATASVISETDQLDRSRQGAFLGGAQSLEFILRDAQALREELATGQQVKLGETLSALLLRARAAGGDLQIQLQVGQAGVAGQGEGPTVADLDAFIKSLQAQIADRRAAAAEIADALQKNVAPPNSSLRPEQRAAYFTRLLDLRRQLEVEEGKRLALKQDRDVALDALQVVRRKVAEEQVTAAQPGSEVRLASKALLPAQPNRPRTTMNALAGGVGGLVLGSIVVLLVELLSGRVTMGRRPAGIERTANSPSSS